MGRRGEEVPLLRSSREAGRGLGVLVYTGVSAKRTSLFSADTFRKREKYRVVAVGPVKRV